MNSIHIPRTRKGQNSYQLWELEAIKACSLGEITFDELLSKLKRSPGSICRKGSQIGWLVKRK